MKTKKINMKTKKINMKTKKINMKTKKINMKTKKINMKTKKSEKVVTTLKDRIGHPSKRHLTKSLTKTLFQLLY